MRVFGYAVRVGFPLAASHLEPLVITVPVDQHLALAPVVALRELLNAHVQGHRDSCLKRIVKLFGQIQGLMVDLVLFSIVFFTVLPDLGHIQPVADRT